MPMQRARIPEHNTLVMNAEAVADCCADFSK
jgi:hypothetical protein